MTPGDFGGLSFEESRGLSEPEAASRLIRDGPNELPAAGSRGIFTLLASIFKEPMILLLLVAVAVYFLLGDRAEAFLLLFSILVIFAITFFQEFKSENALAALRKLSSPRALVIREGIQKRIPGREVVPGDLVLLNEGDRVPADASILWELNLLVDESLLTGESVSVPKTLQSVIYSGTLLVRGRCLGLVTHTGARTSMGRIGGSLQTIEESKTRLQHETARLVRVAAIIGIFCCLLIFVFYGLRFGRWLEGALAGLTTAMSLLPEEFPVVLLIYFAIGAGAISKKNVLTRRMSAIENLGATTVLCVDKTGTLTLNRMTLQALRAPDKQIILPAADKSFELEEVFHELVEYAILASHKDPFDPMDKAIRVSGESLLEGTEHLHQQWTLVREYPLSPALTALSCLWKSPDDSHILIASKGAPEAVMDLCHLNGDTSRFWENNVRQMAAEGYRVLAVAKALTTHAQAHTDHAEPRPENLPASQHDFEFEFLGLLGLADPIRPEVPDAVRECQQAGIRILMMTGDYPDTASHIARQVGLASPHAVLTGKELEKMSDDMLVAELKNVSIIARALPEQKLRIVRMLQSRGEVIAMTGDGVNDGPSLKAADIGIAMGGRGTDVAREAADLVLLDDNFASLTAAIRLGRKIFKNITNAMAYLVAVHVGIAGMALIPVLLGLPLMLFPIHIVFLELIIDPTSALVFEADPEHGNVMTDRPRNPKKPFFSRRILMGSFLQGIVILFLNLGFYGGLIHLGLKTEQARGLVFVSLVLSNLMLILANRTGHSLVTSTLHKKNSLLWVVMSTVTVLLSVILIFEPAMRLFGFERAGAGYLLAAILVGTGSLWFLQKVRVGDDASLRA